MVALVVAAAQAVKAGLHRLAGETACMPLGKVTPVAPKAQPTPATTMFSTMVAIPAHPVHIFGTGDTATEVRSKAMVLVLARTSLAATDTREAVLGSLLVAEHTVTLHGMASAGQSQIVSTRPSQHALTFFEY